MPMVRLSSMYDLQTNSKFGVIGVHTPSAGQLATKYDGLLKNYKYMKLKRCNVKIACASVLPADPLQVGVTAGKISPADMMNPILYRAVSNDSWNVFLNRIYLKNWAGDSADGIDDAFSSISAANSESVYYSLLSSPGWRKVMPQQGLSVKNLKPFVHEVVSVFGQQGQVSSDWITDWQQSITDAAAGTGNSGQPNIIPNTNTVFRGKTLPMPAIPTVQVTGDASSASLGTPGIPKTMVLAIVMPFSQLQVMYYRMIVTWDIVFFGLRPSTEIYMNTAITDGGYARYSRWTVASSKDLKSDEENKADSVGCVDSLNMEPELKMES